MTDTLSSEEELFYVNVYEYIGARTITLSRLHRTASGAKVAARGTCATGRKRCIARKKVRWHAGEFE